MAAEKLTWQPTVASSHSIPCNIVFSLQPNTLQTALCKTAFGKPRRKKSKQCSFKLIDQGRETCFNWAFMWTDVSDTYRANNGFTRPPGRDDDEMTPAFVTGHQKLRCWRCVTGMGDACNRRAANETTMTAVANSACSEQPMCTRLCGWGGHCKEVISTQRRVRSAIIDGVYYEV